MEFVSQENKAKVVINQAGFRDSFNLKSAISKALSERKINFEDILDGDIAGIFLALDSSDDIIDKVFKCLEKSSYNGIKITPELFDDESARLDFYEIVYYCLKVNVYPFFKCLCSKLGIKFEKLPNTDTPK